jgi:glucosamine kinase
VKQVHLGLDVGGTASRWVACDIEGQVVARGSVGGATAHVFNPAERQRLGTALTQLAKAVSAEGLEPTGLVGGLTGFGAAAVPDIRALASTALGLHREQVLVTDDIVLAYAAHFQPGQGHLVSAGTGSIGVHVATDGTMTRVGGRGILIDDGGSGSWIALRALDCIYRTLDRTGSFSGMEALAEALFALVGGTEWHDVRQYVYGGDRGRIGALAVGVARAAEAGDATALDILRQAGAELAELARALRARVGERPVAFIGRVLTLHPAIGDEVRAQLPGLDVSQPAIDSALAAARLQPGGAGEPWRATLAALRSSR